MPKGIFLLIHDEIKGPQIKCSYYKTPISLPQEFISKLYMSHAGFKLSSHLEFKLGSYRSISCFTGNIDRRTKKEGILGIVFEAGENLENLDLFLQRSLSQAIYKPDDETMETVFSESLQNYLELLEFLDKVEVEDILDIFIITGGDAYKNCLLNIGEKQVTNSEMIDIYRKLIYLEEIPRNYYYIKLNIVTDDNIFLLFKTAKPNSKVDKLLKTLQPYLEKYFHYSLEILTLFLYPMMISLRSLKSSKRSKSIDETKTVLQNLKKAENYSKEFNDYLSKVIMGSVKITSNL